MTLSILVIPNAKRNEIVGWVEGALKVRISLLPSVVRIRKLIDFLAETLDLAPSEITLRKAKEQT